MLLSFFINYLKNERNYSIHTVNSYSRDLSQFFHFVGLDFSDVHKVSIDNVRLWLIELKDQEYSSKTINRKISALKNFFNFCEREKYVSKNPLLKIKNLKENKRLPVVVSESSLRHLFNNQDIFSNDFNGVRDRLIMELFYQTGIRLSELINIRIQDYSRSLKELVVSGKRNKQRVIPLTHSIVILIDNYMLVRSLNYADNNLDFLFLSDRGKKTYPKMIYRLVNHYLSMVSSIQKKSPHILRHAFATHLLNNGADLNAIKDLLGHASLLSTQVYTQVSSEKIKKTYKKSHPRGS